LGTHPDTAHRREDLTPTPGVRFSTAGSFLVVLRVDVRPIVILRVLHASRDVASLLRGEDPSEE
jgi:plasmid stabilization system protein ParE